MLTINLIPDLLTTSLAAYTFVARFKRQEWSERPLNVLPARNGGRPVVAVRKEASHGVYPIEYTLRYPGSYRMKITDRQGEVGILRG